MRSPSLLASACVFLPLCNSPTTRCHASQRLPCLWTGSTETHHGGAGAAQRRRSGGAAATRERCSGGADVCASSIQVKGGLVGLRLHSASGAAGDAWHNAGAAVIPRCQIASREALRAGADGRSCRSVAPHAFGMRQPFGCAYVDRPAMRTSSLISPACLFDRVAALRVAALRVN